MKLKRTNMQRILGKPLSILQWILICFSVIAFIFSLIDGFNHKWGLSTTGFQNYLSLFKPYSVLFAATFVVITVNLAIERLGLMAEANTNSFKVGNRTQWTQVVREFFADIIESDPQMCKELMRHLMSIHDYLYRTDYKIDSKSKTEDFFRKYFAERVQWFEQMNNSYMGIACYPNYDYSYTWVNFRYILFSMVNIDDSYDGFLADFEQMYLQKVREHCNKPEVIVDEKVYADAMKNYHEWRQRQTLYERINQMGKI